MLVNMYCYDLKTKVADPTNNAKNIFKAPERVLETIGIMRDKLIPALKAK